MATAYVLNPAQKLTVKGAKKMLTRKRRSGSASRRRTKTNPRRRRRRNPATMSAATTVNGRRSGRRRGSYRRNPARKFAGLGISAALTAVGLVIINAITDRLPLPQGGYARTLSKVAIAWAVHEFGGKVTKKQEVADAVAMVILTQELVQIITPYVSGFIGSATAAVSGASRGQMTAGQMSDVYITGGAPASIRANRMMSDVYNTRGVY